MNANRLANIPRRVYLRYLGMMIPGFVVLVMVLIVARRWVQIPAWLFGTIVFLWILKEMIVFPFVWRAYDQNRAGISRLMIGERGVARERLAPSGYIRVHSELWKAEKIDNGPPIEKGDFVRVEKMEGLKLLVRRDHQEDRGQGREKSGRMTEDPSTGLERRVYRRARFWRKRNHLPNALLYAKLILLPINFYCRVSLRAYGMQKKRSQYGRKCSAHIFQTIYVRR